MHFLLVQTLHFRPGSRVQTGEEPQRAKPARAPVVALTFASCPVEPVASPLFDPTTPCFENAKEDPKKGQGTDKQCCFVPLP